MYRSMLSGRLANCPSAVWRCHARQKNLYLAASSASRGPPSSRALSGGGGGTVGYEWRQRQLEKLERKFDPPATGIVQKDDDLQSMWREMESRVTKRRPRTPEEMGGKTGRVNIKRTDEEFWLREGLYDDNRGDDNDDDEDENNSSSPSSDK